MKVNNLGGYMFSGSGARFMVLLVLVLGGTLAAFGQQITGSIVGTVKDEQGAVIPTATILATNAETGFKRSVPTNGEGEFRLDYLPVGHYTVRVSAPSFKTFVQQNLVVVVAQTQTLGIQLQIGEQSQTVIVTEAPPLVNTSDAALGRSISTAEIIGLPLVNRDAYAELSLTPGVMANNMSQQSDPTGTAGYVNGLPTTDVQINGSIDANAAEVSFYLDGGWNMTDLRDYGNELPNPDALEEFRVDTTNFSAQYGKMSAAVVTAVTKSGTNQFHGSVFEFNRNTDFNAFPWNAPKNSAGQFINAPYHRNQFGGVIGGPIKRNKAFFFFSYGGLRQVIGTYESGARVPTAAERLGDFTGDLPSPGNSKVSNYGSTPFVINMPGTKTIMTGYTNSGPGCSSVGVNSNNPNNENCVPASLADPAAGEILHGTNSNASIPLPNVTPAGANVPLLWSGYFTGPSENNEYLGKYDEVLGAKDHIQVTFFDVPGSQGVFGGGNIVPWTVNESRANQTNANISDVHTFGTSTANQAWVTFTRVAGGRINGPTTTLAQLGSTFAPQGPSTLPGINLSGYFNGAVSDAGPVTASDYYGIRDMISMTKGRHTLYFGGELAVDHTMFDATIVNNGNFTFASDAPTTTGNALSDFYTGMVSSMEQDAPYQTLISAWHTAFFLQDNYRITPRFTANLGVRWDIDEAPVESENRTATFIPSDATLTANTSVTGTESTVFPSAPPGMFFPGEHGVGRGIASTPHHNISPRIGFAWDPWGDGKTAIRAGAGVFYGLVSENEWNQPGNAEPFDLKEVGVIPNSFSNVYAPTLVNGQPSGFPNGDPFPYYFTSPRWVPEASIETINQNVHWPYSYEFNLTVERQLPLQIALTASYVGSSTHNVPAMIDLNYAPYAPGAVTTPSGVANSINARRPYDQNSLGTGSLSEDSAVVSNQTANYNALQVSATRRMSQNVMVSGYYVWSHALESMQATVAGTATGAQDFDNLWEEKGPMADDRRSVATVSGTWNLDYYRGSNFIMKQVVNGWTLSSVYYLQSGAPFTLATGSNKNDDSANANRPDVVADANPSLNPHRSRAQVAAEWFNTAAFVNNGPGVAGGIGPYGADGNAGVGDLRGPGYRDVDLGLFRNFKYKEGMTFQLRGEATNVFNLVSLSTPGESGPPPTVGAAPSSASFGVITGASSPRIIQVGARLTF